MRVRPGPALALILAAALAGCGDTGSEASPAAEAEAPSPEPAPFYVGRWAADPVWCTDQTNGFPITIAETRFEGRENVCDMDGIADTPEGGVTAQLTCQSEGEVIEEPIVFSPAGADIVITWPDRGTETTTFSRCD